MGKVRVLIVDDSAVIRKFLEKVLTVSGEIEIVGTAADPYIAREKLVQLKPDVMTLDVEMPRMDGITFLDKVMAHFPTRTIVFSSLTKEGSETYLRAMEAGAIEVLEKPSIDVSASLDQISQLLTQRVLAVAKARIQPRVKLAQNSVVKKAPSAALTKTTHQIIAIASSTGGTEALKVLLAGMPADIPGTVIVQHMPAGFTKSFSESLNKLYPFEVKEAEEGDQIVPGRVLIAPGNYHLEVVRSGGYYRTRLHQEVPLHNVRPAADYLLKSVAKYAGSNAVGIVLTGMGRDGADGLLEMKNAGSFNVAQNEQTCVVYGMPAAAVKIGAIHKELPLEKIAGEILNQIRSREAA